MRLKRYRKRAIERERVRERLRRRSEKKWWKWWWNKIKIKSWPRPMVFPMNIIMLIWKTSFLGFFLYYFFYFTLLLYSVELFIVFEARFGRRMHACGLRLRQHRQQHIHTRTYQILVWYYNSLAGYLYGSFFCFLLAGGPSQHILWTSTILNFSSISFRSQHSLECEREREKER